jgi:hypothetical protein
MKRFINIAGALYVAFALVAAHTALATTQASTANGANQAANMVVAERVVLDHQRLLQSDATAEGDCDDCDDGCRTNKSTYTVTIWTAGWCSKCPAYKARVKPALLKLGYTVVVKDWDKDSKERPQLRAVPAATIHYKGALIYLKVAPTVVQIDKFVEEHMPDESEETPDNLY